MPRTYKYKTDDLIEIIHEYVATNGACRIVVQRLVEFAKNKEGFESINYQNFTRNGSVKQYIDKYNDSLESKLMDIDKRAYFTPEEYLDARSLYGKSTNEINTIVFHINRILEDIYSNHKISIKKQKSISKDLSEATSKITALNNQLTQLQIERSKLSLQIENTKKQLATERDKNVRLQRLINESILNPNLIMKLEKNGLIQHNPENIILESKKLNRSLEEVIADDTNVEKSIISAEEFEFIEKLEDLYNGDIDEA